MGHPYFEYLPTLISAPFKRSPQQSPLLSMKTSETGSTCSRSTLQDWLRGNNAVFAQWYLSVFFTPSTAFLGWFASLASEYKLDWKAGFSKARLSENTSSFIIKCLRVSEDEQNWKMLEKGKCSFPPNVQEEHGTGVTFFFNFCVEWLLSSCHVMSLNYTKKVQDFTRLFAFGFLKWLDFWSGWICSFLLTFRSPSL